MEQPTAFAFGGEFMAHEYQMAVVYLHIERTRRGYYTARAELFCEDAASTGYGQITDAYVQRLERNIRQNPAAWLWTHKRWKHTPPKDLEAVKTTHRERFEKRFGSESNRF
jgi:KDO2-lipid IV(A) lauroyltransferase